MIKTVTITGADDTIAPADLLALSQRYPYVEWGILLSANSMGQPRFPSMEWLELLAHFKKGKGKALRLSAHFCGSWVTEFLQGSDVPNQFLPDLWPMFNRVQLNTHGRHHKFNAYGFEKIASLSKEKEYIFQFDGRNNDLVKWAVTSSLRFSVLFDRSGGNGVLPGSWPLALDGIFCGYAGGLGPDNLSQEIPKILARAERRPIWLDMETKVRSENNLFFDLAKVETCLRIAKANIVK